MTEGSEFLALDGWAGCPHSGRGVNARFLVDEAKMRLLRDIHRRLDEARCKDAHALDVLRHLGAEIGEDQKWAEEGWVAALDWSDPSSDSTGREGKPPS